MHPLTGYSNRLSVPPGQKIEFKISSQLDSAYEAKIIRIRCADANPNGPGMRETHVPSVIEGSYTGRNQPFVKGSYARTRSLEGCADGADFLALSVIIWPTLLNGSQQTVLHHGDESSGFRVFIDKQARVNAVVAGSQVIIDTPLRERKWYGIEVTASGAELTLDVCSIENLGKARVQHDVARRRTEVDIQGAVVAAPMVIAARGHQHLVEFFNGKVESPRLRYVAGGEESVCFDFDFALGISGAIIVDVGPNKLNGQVFNQPARAMKGSAWSGRELCWRHAPEDYNAIHFHDDDVADCNWQTDITFDVPDDLRSGIYALHLSCEGVEDRIPFFVRPKRGKRQNDICFLVPTFTYVIYGNQARNMTDEAYLQRVRQWPDAREWNADLDPDYGLSTYNRHTDNSGICYGSQNRPMLTTFRPGFVWTAADNSQSGVRHLAADTHITDWLEELEFGYDVITDHDLHEQGSELLDGYRAVITGTHPEYHTLETLTAIEEYLDGDGRLMYLGGNGFYWRIGINADVDGVLEIRRPNGLGSWKGEPGEDYNSLDGRMGGIWQLQGRPPQALVGVGFSTQGNYVGSYYTKQSDAADPAVSWIFEGVDEDVLGDFGLCGGGAAGFEMDRVDPLLGTPENTWVLATSEADRRAFFALPEDIQFADRVYPRKPSAAFATESAQQYLRGDMVLTRRPTGGTIFSVGSITYAGALSFSAYSNNISKITRNVLESFLRRDPV